MLTQALLYALIPLAASGVGGVIAAFWPPSETVRSIVQHFAAGVVFAAAALELIPKVVVQSPWVAILGFGVGIAVMVALRSGTDRLEKNSSGQGADIGLIGAIGVDVLIDGLVTGAGFAAGGRPGCC